MNYIINDPDYALTGWTRQDEKITFKYLLYGNNLSKKQLETLQNNYPPKISETDNNIISKCIIGDEKKFLFSSLKQILSHKYFIFDGKKRTALTIFKLIYIQRYKYTSTYMQEENLDKASLLFEKYGLVERKKHSNLDLYIFCLSEQGCKFRNYLLSC